MLVAIKRCGVDGGSGVYGRHFLIFSPKKVVSCRKERVNLEEPVRVASPHRINLEEPGQGGQST